MIGGIGCEQFHWFGRWCALRLPVTLGELVEHATHGADLDPFAKGEIRTCVAPPIPAPLRIERPQMGRLGLRIENDQMIVVGPSVVAGLTVEQIADLFCILPAAVKGDVHTTLLPAGTALRNIEITLIRQTAPLNPPLV